jgi:hypothetical protein
MQQIGPTCAIEPFSSAHTALKTQTDPGSITAVFYQELARNLARQGLQIQESHPSLEPQAYSIEGAFVRIDEGNRFLRYFLTWVAGAAVVEVEGWLFQGDVPVRELYSKVSLGVGVFGGSTQKLLKRCALNAAKQISNQVAKVIGRR